MKSTKEKAEEYVLGFHTSIQRMCKESYTDGANYVIAEIERALSSNGMSRLKIATIKDVIDKLKEK